MLESEGSRAARGRAQRPSTVKRRSAIGRYFGHVPGAQRGLLNPAELSRAFVAAWVLGGFETGVGFALLWAGVSWDTRVVSTACMLALMVMVLAVELVRRMYQQDAAVSSSKPMYTRGELGLPTPRADNYAAVPERWSSQSKEPHCG